MTNQNPPAGPQNDPEDGEDKKEKAGLNRPQQDEDETEEEKAARIRRDAEAAAQAGQPIVTSGLDIDDPAAEDAEAEAEPAPPVQAVVKTEQPEAEEKAEEPKAEEKSESKLEEEEGERLRDAFNRAANLSAALCAAFGLDSVDEPIVNTLAETVTVLPDDKAAPFLDGIENGFVAQGADDLLVISRDKIYADNEGVTPQTAFEMVLAAMADPSLRDAGVEVKGNARDRMMLTIIATEMGLPVINPPAAAHPAQDDIIADIQKWAAAKNGPAEQPAQQGPRADAGPQPAMA